MAHLEPSYLGGSLNAYSMADEDSPLYVERHLSNHPKPARQQDDVGELLHALYKDATGRRVEHNAHVDREHRPSEIRLRDEGMADGKMSSPSDGIVISTTMLIVLILVLVVCLVVLNLMTLNLMREIVSVLHQKIKLPE